MPTTLAFGSLGHSLPNLQEKNQAVPYAAGLRLQDQVPSCWSKRWKEGKEKGVCG